MRGRVATLPFLVESYGPYAAPRFIVSKLAQTADVEDPDFAEGVELVSWNFVPMSRAVDVYSSQETGGRPDARRARALETLTFRSLDYGPPPDEHSVIVGFTVGQTLHEVRIPWRVVGIPSATMAKDPQVALKAGWNPAAESVRKAKKLMFAPAAWDAQRLKDAKRKAPQRKAPAPAPDCGSGCSTGRGFGRGCGGLDRDVPARRPVGPDGADEALQRSRSPWALARASC